ncbi:hypothetical protein JMUB7514_27640 [Staphylococcus aureus]
MQRSLVGSEMCIRDREVRRQLIKQKTAYEMQRSLVGSEMCIRDRMRRMTHSHQTHDDDGDSNDAVSYTHLTLPTTPYV